MNKQIKAFLISSVAMALFTLTIDVFSWHNRLVTGGLPGYALILNYLTGIPVGNSLFVINTVVLILSFFIIGKTFGIKGVYGYIFVSATTEFWRNFLHLTQINISFFNALIAVVLQGAFASFLIGIIISLTYSFGSYSSIHPLFNKYIKVSAPVFFFACDFFLSFLTFLFFGWEKSILVLVNATVFYFVFNFTLKKLGKMRD